MRLTDNAIDDFDNQIHDEQVTWLRKYGADMEVYVTNGFQITCITDNLVTDIEPVTDGELVAWRGHDGNDYEIFLYDGSSVTQLTDNGYDDIDPQIHSGQIAWRGKDDSEYEIYLATLHKGEIDFDPETGTYTADEENMIPVTISISGEESRLYPGETYTPPDAPSREYTLQLSAGWNMVSLPFLPGNPSASSVLSDAGFYQIVTWSGTGYVAVTEFELGKGYWLLLLEDTNITITG